ncbi:MULTISPECIES: hypothetical protein [unclassified Achromobacter]|uniref:hypothetical protein n=1 Tax=unclassified Achromobacter TaxID=2626865 RepID=UPI0018E9E7A7|nr:MULTISPECIES: hypothetical protein [unclassified Achromobacter]
MTRPQPTSEALLRDYFHGKDENRPLYIARAFAPDARLRMILKTQAIAFPSEVEGAPGIADTLVRKFGQTYENVYTFYLARPTAGARLDQFACDWMVAMTDKTSGQVRVGCGSYDWHFQADPHLVRELAITIDAMEVLPAETAGAVFDWITALPYPWTDRAAISAGAPALAALRPVLAYLNRADA